MFIAGSAFVVDTDTYFSLFDDAMISMRYAKNLADGHGLVWNPGGEAGRGVHELPVDVAARGDPRAAGGRQPMVPLATMLLGAELSCWPGRPRRGRLTRDLLGPDRIAAPAAATILAGTYYASMFWTLRGLEVGMLALLVTAGARDSRSGSATSRPPCRERSAGARRW